MAEQRCVADLGSQAGELAELCRRTGGPVFLTGGPGEELVLLTRGAYEGRRAAPRRPEAGRFQRPGALREKFFAAARRLEECAGEAQCRRRRH